MFSLSPSLNSFFNCNIIGWLMTRFILYLRWWSYWLQILVFDLYLLWWLILDLVSHHRAHSSFLSRDVRNFIRFKQGSHWSLYLSVHSLLKRKDLVSLKLYLFFRQACRSWVVFLWRRTMSDIVSNFSSLCSTYRCIVHVWILGWRCLSNRRM